MLRQNEETYTRRLHLKSKDMDLDTVAQRVPRLFDMALAQVWSKAKYRQIADDANEMYGFNSPFRLVDQFRVSDSHC